MNKNFERTETSASYRRLQALWLEADHQATGTKLSALEDLFPDVANIARRASELEMPITDVPSSRDLKRAYDRMRNSYPPSAQDIIQGLLLEANNLYRQFDQTSERLRDIREASVLSTPRGQN